MNIDDFRKLNTDDKVKHFNDIYDVQFVPSNGVHHPYWLCENKFGSFVVFDSRNVHGEEMMVIDTSNIPNKKCFWANNVKVVSEKEVLEIQLKEEQRRIQKEIDVSNNKQAEIQKKLTELTLPQIGKMYRLTCKSNNASWYGVVVGITKYHTYQFVSYDDKRKVVTEGFPIEGFSNAWSFVEVPEKENIAKSIMEFIKLGESK